MKRIVAILFCVLILAGITVNAFALNVADTVLSDIWDSTSQSLRLTYVASESGWDVAEETALTNTVHPLVTFTHTTSGTPANGIGLSLDWYQETSASNTELGARMAIKANDVTATSEDFQIDWMLMAGGAAAATKMSLGSTGILTLVGGATLDNATSATEVVLAETNIQLTGAIDLEGGNVKINEDSGDYDFAIETDSTDNAFAIDSGNSTLTVDGLTVGFNEASADVDFKIEGNGVDPMLYVDAGNDRIGIGTATPDVQFESLYSGSATNTVDNQFKISSLTSGVPANGIGTGMQFETETSADNYEVGMQIDSVTTDTTGASEDFTFSVKLMAAGAAAAEKFSITSTGVVTLVNAATLDNSTNGTLTVTEPILSMQSTVVNKSCTLGDTDLTPDVSAGCYWLVSQANTGATAITDLDNPAIGATYCILVGSATNPPTLADAGNFNLSAAWNPGLDDNICLYVQADNDYIEISRSDN